MSDTYDYIFSNNDRCNEDLTAVEAVYAIGVIAMTIDNDVADEEIESLELFLTSTIKDSDQRREVRHKIRRLCRESEHGAIFNSAKQALSPEEAKDALLLAIKTIQADHKVKAVESGFIVALAEALRISDETFREIAVHASPDRSQLPSAQPSPKSEFVPEQSPHASSIFSEIVTFFKADNWNIEVLENDLIVRAYFHGENGNWSCFAKAKEELNQVSFYSVCPLTIPTEIRLAMAEFLTRANYGLVIGNFELNLTSGELRYKTSLDVEGEFLSFNLMKNLVYPNLFTMDRYLPGIIAVMGMIPPEEAISRVEGSD